MYSRKLKLLLSAFPKQFVFSVFSVCVACWSRQCKMKKAAFFFSNHLQRLCSSSSFFLIFNCLASSISSFVLLGFFEMGCSPSSFFTICAKKKHLRCEFKRSHHKLHLQKTSMRALLMGDRLPGKDSCLPFRFSSLTSFSQLPCHLLLPAYVAYFSSLSCREPQDRQNTNTQF